MGRFSKKRILQRSKAVMNDKSWDANVEEKNPFKPGDLIEPAVFVEIVEVTASNIDMQEHKLCKPMPAWAVQWLLEQPGNEDIVPNVAGAGYGIYVGTIRTSQTKKVPSRGWTPARAISDMRVLRHVAIFGDMRIVINPADFRKVE